MILARGMQGDSVPALTAFCQLNIPENNILVQKLKVRPPPGSVWFGLLLTNIPDLYGLHSDGIEYHPILGQNYKQENGFIHL